MDEQKGLIYGGGYQPTGPDLDPPPGYVPKEEKIIEVENNYGCPFHDNDYGGCNFLDEYCHCPKNTPADCPLRRGPVIVKFK